MRHNGDRSPEEIEREIARTRGDMDATLTAIEHRLTPGELVDQGLEYLKHNGAKEFAVNLGESAKHNPIPVALVGIGLAWLMAGGNRTPGYLRGGTRTGSGIGERASETFSSASEGAKDKMHSARETLSSARDKLSQSAAGARERVGQLGQSARQMGESARHQAERMRSGYEWLVRDQPLALGAIGLAVGVAFAAAAPRTRKEDELMGEASDHLTERAKSVGKEQMERAKSFGKEELERAKSVGKEQLEKMQHESSQKVQQESSPSRPQTSGQPQRSEISAKSPASPTTPSRDPRLGRP